MVLAHNIEQSNNYLITSKNTTSSKCYFGPRYWERKKLYNVENIKGPRCESEMVSQEYFYLKYILCYRGYDYDIIWNIVCTMNSMLDQDHETWNDLSLNDVILVGLDLITYTCFII